MGSPDVDYDVSRTYEFRKGTPADLKADQSATACIRGDTVAKITIRVPTTRKAEK